ncbi:MAG TPA: VOC family protein, partial [Streptosporangiaceae bacterium]
MRDNASMAQLLDVVIDCSHPAPLARFWAAALDGYAVAPYDRAEIER